MYACACMYINVRQLDKSRMYCTELKSKAKEYICIYPVFFPLCSLSLVFTTPDNLKFLARVVNVCVMFLGILTVGLSNQTLSEGEKRRETNGNVFCTVYA